MKKIIVCFATVFLMFSLSACRSWPPPYGVWYSEYPNITLFVDSALSLGGDDIATWDFPGIYVQNGEKISVTVNFNEKFGMIWIYENVTLENGTIERNTLFDGWYSIENNSLYLDLQSSYQEQIELYTIIFELIEEVTAR